MSDGLRPQILFGLLQPLSSSTLRAIRLNRAPRLVDVAVMVALWLLVNCVVAVNGSYSMDLIRLFVWCIEFIGAWFIGFKSDRWFIKLIDASDIFGLCSCCCCGFDIWFCIWFGIWFCTWFCIWFCTWFCIWFVIWFGTFNKFGFTTFECIKFGFIELIRFTSATLLRLIGLLSGLEFGLSLSDLLVSFWFFVAFANWCLLSSLLYCFSCCCLKWPASRSNRSSSSSSFVSDFDFLTGCVDFGLFDDAYLLYLDSWIDGLYTLNWVVFRRLRRSNLARSWLR